MVLLKYDASIDKNAIKENLKRLINQIYKLLPNRGEGLDWKKQLTTILIEFCGMDRLLLEHHTILFSLLCKLEGMFALTSEKDFLLFRKTIFECLELANELSKTLCL